jgi:hypothetical protein
MKYAIEYSFFKFVFHISASFRTHTKKKKKKKKKKKNLVTCKFLFLNSHVCHILKELYEFLCMMDASIIFGEDIYITTFSKND